MRAKNALQLRHHRSVVGMIFGWSERTAAQTPAESLPIQNLVVRQIARGEDAAIKETLDILAFRIRIFHPLVVNAEALKQVFVSPREPRFFYAAVIPEDHDPAARFKDARKFAARGPRVEPVESLGGGDEINTGIGECSGFGRSFDAREAVVGGEIFFAGLAHFQVGLDAEDAVAVFKEKFAEKAGAGTDVSDDVVGAQAAIRAQKIQHGRGVAGAIADVIRDAIGEALFGVGESHGRLANIRS